MARYIDLILYDFGSLMVEYVLLTLGHALGSSLTVKSNRWTIVPSWIPNDRSYRCLLTLCSRSTAGGSSLTLTSLQAQRFSTENANREKKEAQDNLRRVISGSEARIEPS